MWIRSLMLAFAAGCVGVAGTPDDPTATASADITTGFECLNHTTIQVVSCSGSISLFPITITIEHLYVLNDNEIDILSGDLNDLSILDGNLLDHNTILDDVETTVVGDALSEFGVTITRNDVSVCTSVLGVPVCR